MSSVIEKNTVAPIALMNEFRLIKQRLISASLNEHGKISKNRIMFTSTGEKAGVSFCADQLARSVSMELDTHSLLIQTKSDNTEPGLSGTGLLDYLSSNNVEIKDIIQTPIEKGYRLIPFGRPSDIAHELLSGNKMKQLMRELQERYTDRLVVFDCPPLLSSTQSTVIAGSVDQIVVVIEEGKTKVQDLKRLIKLLPSGVLTHYVLNKKPH